jgi:ATP phosphoribosyltransferase regulatory subunit HisZ
LHKYTAQEEQALHRIVESVEKFGKNSEIVDLLTSLEASRELNFGTIRQIHAVKMLLGNELLAFQAALDSLKKLEIASDNARTIVTIAQDFAAQAELSLGELKKFALVLALDESTFLPGSQGDLTL